MNDREEDPRVVPQVEELPDYGFHCYDREGNRLTMEEWSKLFSDMEYKVVEKTDVGDYTVSTVWLGLDHSLGILFEGGVPIIFETMVFIEAEENLFVDIQERYATEEGAKLGHQQIVREVTQRINKKKRNQWLPSFLQRYFS